MGAPGTTEGPWCVYEELRGYDAHEEGLWLICVGPKADCNALGEACVREDAHQMAASGALYDALVAMVADARELGDLSLPRYDAEDQPKVRQALAALALARGESQ